MPLTKAGRKAKRAMMHRYGKERGAAIFFASENKRIPGSNTWTRRKARQKKSR